MSILSVSEDYSYLKATDKIDAEQIMIVVGRAQRRFQVLFGMGDAAIDRPFMALNHASIPQLWDAHPNYEYWFVSNREAYYGNGPLEVFVDVNYEYIENPLEQPPEVTYFFEKSTEPIDHDVNDTPILNSADEPFDPHVQKEFADLVIRIVKNELFYDPTVTQQYIGAVCSANWTPACIGKMLLAKTVKCIMIDSAPRRYGAVNYYQKTYEFRVRDDKEADGTLIGWKRRLLDQGLREKTGTDTDGKPTYAAIQDDNGKSITTPVPLDGAGKKLDDGADPVFKLWEVDKMIDFTGLNL